MNLENKPNSVADDVVVTLQYSLSIDGEVIDSSEENEPILFLQGHGQIVPGLEKELYGLKVGDSKQLVVPAKEGYGELDPSAIMDVPKDEFPEEIPLKAGVELRVRDEDGEVMDATIVSVSKDTVKLDFNHPLAGKDLAFDVTVLELREATEEELEHGHVHGDDDDEDFEFEFDEEDFEEFSDENEE